MKIISVFLTVFAFVLNLSFNVVNCDLRFYSDLTLDDYIGTENGQTLVNGNFAKYKGPPYLVRKIPIVRNHTVLPLSNNKYQSIVNAYCNRPIHPPLRPKDNRVTPTDRPIPKSRYGENGPLANIKGFDINDVEFSYDDFSTTLIKEKANVMIGIARVWNECRKRFPERLDIAVRIFIKPNHERNTTEYGKDLLDCTLRGMRVITDEGFQVDEYLVQIRNLLFNYTSFDINDKSDEIKQFVRQTIEYQLVKRFHRRYNCYPSGSRLKNARQFGTSDRKSIPSCLVPALCHDLMESYELAARECKNKTDIEGKSVEASWMIVQCIEKGNLDRMFEGPFYPDMFTTAVLASLEVATSTIRAVASN